MLRKRILTAVILIPLCVLMVLYLSTTAFGLITAFFVLACAWEWAQLSGLRFPLSKLIYLCFITIVLFASLFIPLYPLFFVTSAAWLIAFLLILFYPRHFWGNSVFWRALMGVFVLVPCWVAINFIREQDNGSYVLLYLFVLIWGADTAAYFVGKQWGKTPLAPAVSPGKSVQGLIGASLFGILFALLMQWLGQVPVYLWFWGMLLSLVTVLFSIVGDLFESMLKRQAGVKDSGHILPGHGGLLDRIDSLTAAAPIFVTLTLLIKYI